MARRRPRIRRRTLLVISSVLLWTAAVAPPAYAATGVACTYGGSTITVSLSDEDGWGYYGTLNLVRTPSGDVSIVEQTYDEGFTTGPGIVCGGGDGADPASSVSIAATSGAYLSLNILLANWTSGTSVSIDGSVSYLDLGLVGTEGPDVIHTSSVLPAIAYPGTPAIWVYGLGGEDDLVFGAMSSFEVWSGFVSGGGGDDSLRVTLEQGAGLYGGDGHDVIDSSLASWSDLDGGAGNDVLTAGDGADSLSGGEGDDQLFAGDGDDYVQGQAGDDEIDAGGGADSVNGGDGDDVIAGGDGDDWIQGDEDPSYWWDTPPSPGDDRIDGGPGDDALVGWGGNDIIYGGPGSDPYLDGGDGDDYLDGGTGDESLWGQDGNDVLIGGAGSDYYLDGGPGNDLLDGGDGSDTLLGASGDDVLHGGEGDDGLLGGYDWRSERAGDDHLFGDGGDDALFASAGAAATLDGGIGTDSCEGYSGTPRGSGHYARARYAGCERAKTYVASCTYSPAGGGVVDVTVAGPGAILSLQRTPSGQVSVAATGYDYTVRRMADATYSIPLLPAPAMTCAGGSGANTATSVVVHGPGSSVGVDVVLQLANWTIGTSVTILDPDGAEVDDYDSVSLVGSDGPDVIDPSNLGFDLAADGVSDLRIFGEGGDDVLTAGIPASVGHITYFCFLMLGGDGNDVLVGSDAGCEGLYGEPGNDLLEGGAGYDFLNGGSGDDILRGGDGSDYLVYYGIMYGRGIGHDLLDGGGDGDYCAGYAGSPSGVRLYSGVTYENCESREWGGGAAAIAPSPSRIAGA